MDRPIRVGDIVSLLFPERDDRLDFLIKDINEKIKLSSLDEESLTISLIFDPITKKWKSEDFLGHQLYIINYIANEGVEMINNFNDMKI